MIYEKMTIATDVWLTIATYVLSVLKDAVSQRMRGL